MRKRLSSQLTIFYKIIVPVTWALIILGLMIFMFIDSRNPMAFLIILMLLPMLLFMNLKQISYDDDNIYVYNWRTTKTYEIKDIKSINEGDIMSLDPFFEIEVRGKSGSVEKIDFMPKTSEQLTFMLTKKYSGRLHEIKTKVVDSRRTRNWLCKILIFI